MAIDLSPLLNSAFFVEEVENASEAIERMLEAFERETGAGARAFEVVVPGELDDGWVRDRLVHPLVYFCESEGTPVPACRGMVIALFLGLKLYGIPAEHVIRWAGDLLGTSVDQLRQDYGTHEVETALR
jgi:hypothetical protein